MKSILKQKAYRKLLESHRRAGKELRYPSRLRLGKTLDALEAMLNLMVRGDSSEDRRITSN